jgi:hypothetical protein
LIFFK